MLNESKSDQTSDLDDERKMKDREDKVKTDGPLSIREESPPFIYQD